MAREKGMGSLQLEKSGRWTMRASINGKKFSRSTRTKDRDQAERFLQRFLAPFGRGEHRIPLADVWLEYLKSPLRNEQAQSTLKAKRNTGFHFAKWMEHSYLPVRDLSGITADMIAEYLVCMRSEVSAGTYNGRVCILREIFHTLSKKAGLADDPWEGVRLRPDDCHSRRELTIEELHRLLNAAKQFDQNQIHLSKQANNPSEWYKLFLIGIYTGLRLGDCCKLDWSQIKIPQGIIQLIPSKTRRHAHGHPITIPIHQVLGQALMCNGNQQPTSSLSGPVLPTINALYRRSRSLVSCRLTIIFRNAKITTSVKLDGRRHKTPEATFHSLRHTFVSLSANAGVPLHIVQSIVGHESTAMTRHYYHENIDSLRRAVDAIPAIT